MLRISSPLGHDTETLVTRVIGSCINVHKALGPGLLESVYAYALCAELEALAIPYERERVVNVVYRGRVLCDYRLDLVVGGQLVLELKAVERLLPIHRAQLLSYMRMSAFRVGLLVNFNVVVLPDGLKRFVL